MNPRLEALLTSFQETRKEGPFSYRWHHTHDGGTPSLHVVFSAIIHGDEVGSIPGMLRAMDHLKSGQLRYGGKATFVLGNPEAARKNRRFLETDLNRLFIEHNNQTHEGLRSEQLKPIFDSCDLLVDFHQTILPTKQPFYIFPWSAVSWQWAQALQIAAVCVDATPSSGSATPTSRCADDYVNESGRPAVTIELGEKGFCKQAEDLTYSAITQALHAADRLTNQQTDITAIAAASKPLTLYETVHREPYSNSALRLRPGLINFQPVTAGELLTSPESPQLLAPASGMLLFPKYLKESYGTQAATLPKEIFRIIQPASNTPKD